MKKSNLNYALIDCTDIFLYLHIFGTVVKENKLHFLCDAVLVPRVENARINTVMPFKNMLQPYEEDKMIKITEEEWNHQYEKTI